MSSSTCLPAIQRLAFNFMLISIRLKADGVGASGSIVKQHIISVKPWEKTSILVQVLKPIAVSLWPTVDAGVGLINREYQQVQPETDLSEV